MGAKWKGGSREPSKAEVDERNGLRTETGGELCYKMTDIQWTYWGGKKKQGKSGGERKKTKCHGQGSHVRVFKENGQEKTLKKTAVRRQEENWLSKEALRGGGAKKENSSRKKERYLKKTRGTPKREKRGGRNLSCQSGPKKKKIGKKAPKLTHQVDTMGETPRKNE